MRVLITGARAPVAMHLSRHFKALGHDPVLADTPRFAISRATETAPYVRLPPPRSNLEAYGAAIKTLVREAGIDLIVPTCEEVFYLAALRDLKGLDLPVFAPSFDRLRLVHDKGRFADMTRGYAACAPESHRLTTPEEVEAAIARPGEWIYKPVWSRFGDQVLIRPEAEAVRATVRRVGGDWLQQAYLPGEELCAYAVAYNGRLVALSSYRPLWRADRSVGAGVFVEPVSDLIIEQFVSGFCEETNWHGQVSFDFRRDDAGQLHVIECNPRATTGALFFGPDDDLGAAFTDGTPARPSRTRPLSLTLAMWLFGWPQALKTHRFSQWQADMCRFDGMLDWPGDRQSGPMQALALMETVWLSLKNGQSLKAAATADIEWNGEPLGPDAEG